MRSNSYHESVLYKEVLEALLVQPNGVYLDATLGGGGHTKGILEKGGRVIGLDVDPEAINYVSEVLALKVENLKGRLFARGERVTLAQGNFTNLANVAENLKIAAVDGCLFDLGASSHQLETPERGFSLKREGPLDMRMDPDLTVTAADLVNGLNVGELYELFNKLGEDPNRGRIARAIVQARIKEKIERTEQLREIVEKVVPTSRGVHPATRVFQALRIAVNDELNNLRTGLQQATRLLRKNGRLVVISFHSLEDRIVKNFLHESKDLKILTKKPLIPSREEVLSNPRSRSAKLRIAEKV